MGNIYRDTTLNNVSEQDIGKELKAGLKISVTTEEYLSLI